MRVAILSESPADEAALRILTEAVLGRSIEPVGIRRRAGGWQEAFRLLPNLLKGLHYYRQAEALVFVVDSNGTPVHPGGGDGPCEAGDDCRLCRARRIVREVQGSLRPVGDDPPVRVALGLAVPQIEAWYLCGQDPNVSENAWVQAMAESRRLYRRGELKERVYGTDRPSLARETQRATEEVTRVAADLDALERKFPVGFGALRADLQAWVL